MYPVVSLQDWPECFKVSLNIQIRIRILPDFDGGNGKWLTSPFLTWQQVWWLCSVYRTATSSTSRRQSQHDMTRIEEMPIRYDRVHGQVIRSIVFLQDQRYCCPYPRYLERQERRASQAARLERWRLIELNIWREKMTELRCQSLTPWKQGHEHDGSCGADNTFIPNGK